jgi:hypothetical protein
MAVKELTSDTCIILSKGLGGSWQFLIVIFSVLSCTIFDATLSVISYNMTFIRLAHTNQIGMRTTA